MLTKRIIPCLDVKDNQVVKGIQFKNHKVVGDIVELAKRYQEQGADELVFYDITASCSDRSVSSEWVSKVARVLDIPFCVAGGIRDAMTAEKILRSGADKISINSPALENPDLIDQLVAQFGSQCVVVGIDSKAGNVYQYTGDESKSTNSKRKTIDWAQEVQTRGAGEIVLNCMEQDGVKQGYDIEQLKNVSNILNIPVIASGGAGETKHFVDVFQQTNVSGALAASVFHSGKMTIPALKENLKDQSIEVRI